ncbi:MAG TPA: hypothetical protein VNU96_19955 [Burkholderiales bacterium]|jgi:hypothetical protein|nr:hypothetical protein [Burkholderiales bacterium]
MFQVQVAWLDEQKSLARFSLPGRDEWTVEHITALMRLLGEIREQMSPGVAEAPPPLPQLAPLHAPRYRTVLHEFSGGSLIQFRHPSLGWLEFLLPSVERRRMAEHFATQESQWEHMHRPAAP